MAVWVHGCFWHGHLCSKGVVRPKTNADFWAAKLLENTRRDERALAMAQALGWNVRVIWECSLEADCSKLIAELRLRDQETTRGSQPGHEGSTPPLRIN